MPSNQRQRAEQRGRRAETLAALWLRLKGYRVLARRYKTPVGEIDLIIQRGNTLAFVEVKARASRTDALEAISPQARQRISRAAQWFLSHRASNQPKSAAHMAPKPHKKAEITRFDMVLVVPGRPPHHIQNAWTDGLA